MGLSDAELAADKAVLESGTRRERRELHKAFDALLQRAVSILPPSKANGDALAVSMVAGDATVLATMLLDQVRDEVARRDLAATMGRILQERYGNDGEAED